MSRVTAPITKHLTRSGLVDHHAGAVLMPKYADLLRSRRSADHTDVRSCLPSLPTSPPNSPEQCNGQELTSAPQSSRGLTTTHRPTPQPSIANRTKPLMQTFHSGAPSSSAAPSSHLDATVLPSQDAIFAASPSADAQPMIPILPDNTGYTSPLASAAAEEPSVRGATIVAADPDRVMPSTALSGVEAVGLDGVDLKFAHESTTPQASEGGGGMLKDLWRGMVEDVFGSSSSPKKAT